MDSAPSSSGAGGEGGIVRSKEFGGLFVNENVKIIIFW
jgi:hypothetical protein